MIQRCTANSPISQSTVLAMLSAVVLQVGITVEYTSPQGMTLQLPVSGVNNSTNTVTLLTDSGTITVSQSQISVNNQIWLAKLPLTEWTITSFDPLSRVVCINVNSPSGPRYVSITLPNIYAAHR
jgi:hypothetical protein